jgi:kynurenine 3-monooxygenase
VGLEQKILDISIPMRGRVMHGQESDLSYQPYGAREDHVINSVSRGDLNRALLSSASEYDSVKLTFDHKCTSFDLEGNRCTFTDSNTGESVDVQSDVVIGSDGAWSAIRKTLQREDGFTYSQTYLDHGYKELHIPPDESGGFRIDKNALHIWPRRQFMMIALPNFDGSFTVTLFWPFEGEHGFGALSDEKGVREYFEKWFPDAVSLMPTLVEDYLETAPSSLATIRCYPWSFDGRVSLVGDACHGVVPFYGQGMNAAFEDCRILDECIARHWGDWAEALDRYQQLRKKNVDALADLAISNFIEMRDHVASPWFLFKKRLDKLLHRIFPNLYLPLYSMISFSSIPYAEAVARSRLQARILKTLAWTILVILLVILVRIP